MGRTNQGELTMAKKVPPPFMKKGDKKEEKGKGKEDKCPDCKAPMKNGKCTKCGYKAK
jgi:hypothetical protein